MSGQRESLEPQVLSGLFAPFGPHQKGLAAGAAKHSYGRDCRKKGKAAGGKPATGTASAKGGLAAGAAKHSYGRNCRKAPYSTPR